MREFSIEDNLKKKLDKVYKKDRALYGAVMNKIGKIINCEDINHYKNLRSPLQDFKRVHIRGSFVLLFKYLKHKDTVVFYDLDHHDFIYK